MVGAGPRRPGDKSKRRAREIAVRRALRQHGRAEDKPGSGRRTVARPPEISCPGLVACPECNQPSDLDERDVEPAQDGRPFCAEEVARDVSQAAEQRDRRVDTRG
jgi:hypothetical protein